MADVLAIKQAVGDLDEGSVTEKLNAFIASGPGEDEVQAVVAACQQGMEIVGEKFGEGEYFVGDLIFAGELLTDCIDMLKPLLGGEVGGSRGTIVLGTVEGDIHDIGKNIFRSMSEAAGFHVVDLGIDQPPSAFVAAVEEHKPQIVGMSGVLTLSIDSMKRTVEALQEKGLRGGVKVAIGGNAVSQESCQYIGADAWSKNAAESVKTCGGWV
ncbi:MAG: cobalamin-dependent protein [Oscillospiraceae bacterium]|nr:cobalamin-dependent protein [Oscillospiraceae bacterium]